MDVYTPERIIHADVNTCNLPGIALNPKFVQTQQANAAAVRMCSCALDTLQSVLWGFDREEQTKLVRTRDEGKTPCAEGTRFTPQRYSHFVCPTLVSFKLISSQYAAALAVSEAVNI